ncbi:hypothetical protein [Archangium sp.]|jgi:hypothetical protein|uniref:hypothetical protein n=1 Tax=Archangium sp. TaxID=1872627 RepID=UPI002ED7B07F
MPGSPSHATPSRAREGTGLTALGLVLVIGAVYALSGSGRVDMIDGQFRFEVARNLLETGSPALEDPALVPFGVPSADGQVYSRYGIGGSLTAMPAMWLVSGLEDPKGELARFAFSFTSALFAALCCGLLYVFYRQLGVAARAALGWTLACAFATLLWPGAVTSFTNAQTAPFLLLALLWAHRAATRESTGLALAAGLSAGLLLLFEEYFLVLIPVLGLAVLQGGPVDGGLGRWLKAQFHPAALRQPRSAARRYVAFAAGVALGLGLFLAFNAWRFGSPFTSGKSANLPSDHPFLGNPLAGFLGLLVSPGKGILWYSPPVLLAVAGLRHLWRRHASLVLAMLGVTTALVLLISPLAFYGGEWCWGPRYLLPLVPAWALAFPFVPWRRAAVASVLVAGVLVQVLGISVDHQRFFFERGWGPFFWGTDPWYTFRESALVARVGEAWSLREGPPVEARTFTPAPYPEFLTYAPFGPPRRLLPREKEWVRQFTVFYVPRPWPLWMGGPGAEQSPVDTQRWVLCFVLLGALGGVVLRRGLSVESEELTVDEPRVGVSG